MTGPQANGLPFQILVELAREPHRWFPAEEISLPGEKLASIKRAMHRLINDEMVEVQNKNIGSGINPDIRTFVKHKEGAMPTDVDTRDPYEWAIAMLGDQQRPCSACEGTGQVSHTPTRTEMTKALGFTWAQLAKRKTDKWTVLNLKAAKALFGTKTLDQAFDVLEEMRERST